MTRVLVIPGSRRTGSHNRKLAALALRLVREAGGEATLADLSEFEMPLYDGDLEAAEGLPEGALRLKEVVDAHDAVIFAAPEYNASLTPLLKNAIDWTSRPTDGRQPDNPWANRVGLLLSASPGALGGLRGLVHLRAVLERLGVWVMPQTLAVGTAHKAFDRDGNLDEGRQATLQGLIRRLLASTPSLRDAA